jgi:membrane-bound lytic murein transglycosylase B
MRNHLLLIALLLPGIGVAADLPGIPQFVDEMVARHQFDRDHLEAVFAHAQHRPAIIEAMSRPATRRPWPEYRASFVNAKRIKLGRAFAEKYRLTLQRAERRFGIPGDVIVALIGVETIYGKNMGNYPVLDALTTLAFDYPRRAEFFRVELENYLLLSREKGLDMLKTRGSYAGAIGIPQFMPSSYRRYAIDFNGNQTVDLRREARDAIGSVANYLQGYGWVAGQPIAERVNLGTEPQDLGPHTLAEWSTLGVVSSHVGAAPNLSARLLNFATDAGDQEWWLAFENFEVVTRYNNSNYYAMSVTQLAEQLSQTHKLSSLR